MVKLHSQVVSHVTNPSSEAQEVTFKMRLPEKAFIHNFSMEVEKCPDEDNS